MSIDPETVPRSSFEQTVAIFSSREDVQTLLKTIEATKRAVHCARACIDVVVNGNRALADALPSHLNLGAPDSSATGRVLKIWFVTMGDKAHAWNEYTQRIWPKSQFAFFVDGMARPNADAFDAMASGMSNNVEAWGATAVPTHGMSARSQRRILLTEGGIQGNLYAVRGVILRQLVDSGFALPRGIYRTDPLLAAALCFSLDPANNVWNSKRIHVEIAASWDYDALKWWRFRDLVTHFRRVRRQHQGVLENAAIKQWLAVEKKSPSALPETAAEMVAAWMRRHPNDADKLLKSHRWCREALERLLAPRDWSAVSIAPIMLGQQGF